MSRDPVQLDDLDRQIIAALQRDGRVSNRAISRELGVSEGTIRARIKRLRDEGLIRIIAVRNLEHGSTATVHLGIITEPGQRRQVANALAALPHVPFVAMAVGRYDIVAMVLTSTRAELADVMRDELPAIPGIRRIESTETVKSVAFAPNLRKIR